MKKNSKKQTAERAQGETKIKDDYPDFAARCKKIFGGRVLTVVDDLIRDRGRY